MTLTIGSLCSGAGMLDMAVMDVLDASVAWHAQYDPDDRHQYAAKILAHHWPDVPNHGDITSIDWADVEPVDILTAGFPCQPVSNAGKRKGKADERWLWPEVEAAIRGVRPRLVFLENVSALANRGGDAVLGSLAAFGFDAEWTCLRASDVGAPHQRQRWFCLAWNPDDDLRLRPRGPVEPQEPDQAGDTGGPAAHPESVGQREPADQAHPLAGGRDAREEPRRRGVRTATDADGGRLAARERHLRTREPDSEGCAPSDAEGLGRGEGRPEPTRLERRPDVAECGGEALADSGRVEPERRGGPGELGGQAPKEPRQEGQRERPGDTVERRGAAPADADDAGAFSEPHRQPERPEGLDEHAELDPAGRVLDWGDYGPAIARWESVMGHCAPAPTEPGKNGPRLAPRFVEWLMGAPEGHITGVPGIPRNAQLKAAGNGVVRQQGAEALRRLLARREAAHA